MKTHGRLTNGVEEGELDPNEVEKISRRSTSKNNRAALRGARN